MLVKLYSLATKSVVIINDAYILNTTFRRKKGNSLKMLNPIYGHDMFTI